MSIQSLSHSTMIWKAPITLRARPPGELCWMEGEQMDPRRHGRMETVNSEGKEMEGEKERG